MAKKGLAAGPVMFWFISVYVSRLPGETQEGLGDDSEGSSRFALFLSLQSCPTLCDPIDGSPSGSPVPGILQARTLEWVAISFSNA